MRLPGALLLSLGAFVRPASAQELVPGARGLTLEELAKLVATETGKEFSWDDTDPAIAEIASNLWQDANYFEWQKAAAAELATGQKYPYLLCHVGKDADGGNLSGYRRKLALKEAIGYTDEKGWFLRPLYNKEEYLCGYGQLPASVAASVTGDDFIVQPLVSSLKYMEGSLDGMEDEMKFYNDLGKAEFNPSLDIVLCPGVSVADPEVGTESIQKWEDIPEETAAEIIETLVPKTVASEIVAISDRIELTEMHYLTSEMYANATQNLGEEVTARSKMWKDLINEFQQSGKCDTTYETRLKWTISRAIDPETDASLLNVEFDTTGDSELDVGCMLTLSLAIVAHPDVCSLEARKTVETKNKVIQWLIQSELEERRPYFDTGLDGSGQVVAVSDTGVDQDHCYFYDPNVSPNSALVDTSARKLAQYVDFVDKADYEYGHGSHVAGTIAGKRIDGAGMADGVAPGAKLAVADIGDSTGELYLPLDSQLLKTGSPDAKIHSASWGSELNYYTTQARNFDQYMFDHDDFLIVVAAGNSGAGDTPNTVGTPATAKNIIAVGAHHNTGSSRPKHGLGPSYIADFSSRGPTLDGRTKPDILAPGKAVLSAGARPDEKGECDPDKVPSANSKSDGLLSLQGTSMATPVVAGAAAIVRQYFEEGYYPTGVKTASNAVANPSGALIKAVLMNGAQFVRGVDNGAITEVAPYDNAQNFGRLAMQHSLYIPGKTEAQLTMWDREVVEDGDVNRYSVTIDKSFGCAYDKLHVTLVWMEQGSSPGCTSCVLNDLDLEVEMGGRTYYPNGRSGADRTNNAERVIVEGVRNGDEAIITVSGTNLMSANQQYTLVATGCFGGQLNLNFANGACSVFVCDDSRNQRILTLVLAIVIPIAAILIGCGLMTWCRRRKEKNSRYRPNPPYEGDAPSEGDEEKYST